MNGALAVLDWGIGGVGVVAQLRRRVPTLPIIYFSDSGYTPYGLLAVSELRLRLRAITEYLARCGAGGLVVACNAASTALDALSIDATMPTWGVIDAAIQSVPRKLGGTLGVIGGRRTIRCGIYRQRLAAPGRRVVQRIAQPLSAHIEAGTSRGPECARVLAHILEPLRGADGVLLACTHYPAVRELIAAQLPGTELFDPAEALAQQVLMHWHAPSAGAQQRVFTTGDPRATWRAAQQAWNFDLGDVEALGRLEPVSGPAEPRQVRHARRTRRSLGRDSGVAAGR